MNKPVKISVVSPVYGSPALIPQLCDRLHASLKCITESYEIILVFDCSPDDGWERIRRECTKDSRVKGIQLSRNFGQHYAITAGLEYVSGEWVVVMDCDLQDRPEEIVNLFNKAREAGVDIVFAQRQARRDHLSKRLSSAAFYTLFSFMTDSKQDASIANFGIYHRRVVRAMLSMKDKVRYFPTMAQWVGFKSAVLPVDHAARAAGETTYSWRRLFRLAFDNMIAFSDKPLHLTVQLGMAICLFAFGAALFYLLRYLVGGITVSGFTSLILSVWFLSGIIIFILGVIGVYLGRVFDQVKNRPFFIIREKENLDDR
jgi:dolichol-phosphate mannosyltransferase